MTAQAAVETDPDEDGTPHRWVAASEMVLSPREVAGVARRLEVERSGTVRIDVIDVYCRVCRKPFSMARHTLCDVDGTPKGGPLKRRTVSERDLVDV